MPLLDLSKVTKSLMRLLSENVNRRFLNLIPGEVGSVTVVPQSPDKVTNAERTLSLYLYHMIEDPYYKNLLPLDGAAGPSIDRISLALCLYYVLTPHHDPPGGGGEPELDALEEQAIFGYGLKTLHDYPVITESTEIANIKVLDDDLVGGDNSIQVIFRPVPPEESISFWSAEDHGTTRLSAYYEMRVILMEPERPKIVPGFVLSLGSFVQPIGAAFINNTEGLFRFTPPGFDPQLLSTSPAQAPIEPSNADEPPTNRLIITGQGIGGGALALRSPLFPAESANQVLIDPAFNPAWAITSLPGGYRALVQDTITLEGGGSVTLLPGIYGLSIKLVTVLTLPDSSEKSFVKSSNECAITLAPALVAIDINGLQDPTPTALLTIDGGFDLQAPELAGQIEVYVNGSVYTESADPLQALTFAPAASTILIRTDFGADDPGIYPLRVVIRGASSPPAWIEVAAP